MMKLWIKSKVIFILIYGKGDPKALKQGAQHLKISKK